MTRRVQLLCACLRHVIPVFTRVLRVVDDLLVHLRNERRKIQEIDFFYHPRTEYDGRLCFYRCVSVHGRGGEGVVLSLVLPSVGVPLHPSRTEPGVLLENILHTYNEFGYNKHLATISNFFSCENIHVIDINVKEVLL